MKSKLTMLISAMVLGSILIGYFYTIRDMGSHVSDQAKQSHISVGAMWLKMVKRTALYIFLPALIITITLVTIALLITRRN